MSHIPVYLPHMSPKRYVPVLHNAEVIGYTSNILADESASLTGIHCGDFEPEPNRVPKFIKTPWISTKMKNTLEQILVCSGCAIGTLLVLCIILYRLF